MRESLVKTGKSNIKDILLLSEELTAEEKLHLAKSLLPFMSKSELASLLRAIANQID